MIYQDAWQAIVDFFNKNAVLVFYSFVIVAIAYFIFFLLKKNILRLKRKEKIDQTTSKNIISFIRISIYIFVIIGLSLVFVETFGVLAGIFTVAGGTIIGFAAMNTIGNIIAGLIVMVSRPFEVGDRIYYNKKLADVMDIKLVYTVLKDIDGIIISIPNQELLKTEIHNYGKNRIIRREIHVTPGFDVEPELVDKALLEAAKSFNTILQFPEPRVDIFNFLDFAVDYRLLVYINNSKIIPKFDHDLRRKVLQKCKEYGIDISTPSLIMNVGKRDSKIPSMDAIKPEPQPKPDIE